MNRIGLLAVITIAGCAAGGSPSGQGDAASVDAARPDSPRQSFDDAPSGIDGSIVDARPDAPPPDAPPDAAPAVPDACVPAPTEKLANPSFDSQPVGTGWTETRVVSTLALVTDEGVEDTAPYSVYLGGYAGEELNPPRSTFTDVITQTVTFPADTTTVVLTGKYFVSTAETVSGIYDRASIALVDAGTDALIETAFETNDDGSTNNAFVPFTKTFTSNLAGRSVKLRILSSHDSTDATAFLFDTFSLKATHCP